MGGPLGRQEARREAVLRARRPVGRPSWAPGGPSGGRLGGQEPRTVGFADSCNENAGFAQAAGRAQGAGRGQADFQSYKAARGSPQNFYIDIVFSPPDLNGLFL